MKGGKPRPRGALDVAGTCWRMMSYRLPRPAQRMVAALRPWAVLCAAGCVMLGGCQMVKPAANCSTAAVSSVEGAQGSSDGKACRRGPWLWFAHREVDIGPVRSPFLPVPTYNVYHYAAAPMTVVPMAPVPSGPPAPPPVAEPRIERTGRTSPPSAPLPAPWRETPAERLPLPEDAPSFEKHSTDAREARHVTPASAVTAHEPTGRTVLRIRPETLDRQPEGAEASQ